MYLKVSPFKRKKYSLEKIRPLRERMCDTYKLNTGEDLYISKDKKSIYLIELSEDIFLTTKRRLGEGTLEKFSIKILTFIMNYLLSIPSNCIFKKVK